MTVQEAKQAFFDKIPIARKFGNVITNYDRIEALRYSFDDKGNMIMECELLDRNGRAIFRTLPKYMEYVNDESKKYEIASRE